MTEAAVIQAIRERFDTEVATPASLRIIYDNAPEDPAVVQRWCRFSVQIDDTQQVSMGVRRFRATGAAVAQFFGPIAKGDAALNALADSAIAAFRGVRLTEPMVTFAPSPSYLGTADRDEAWCRRAVRIPFRADIILD